MPGRDEAIGRPVPVHYQEPFRRGYGRWEPSSADFLADLRGAVAGGAAGWCLHNGSSRGAAEGRPRRSFDLRARRLFDQLDAEERERGRPGLTAGPPGAEARTVTGRVSPRRTRRGLQGAGLASADPRAGSVTPLGGLSSPPVHHDEEGSSPMSRRFLERFVAGVMLLGVGAVPGRAQEPPGGRPAGPALRVSEDGRHLVRDRRDALLLAGGYGLAALPDDDPRRRRAVPADPGRAGLHGDPGGRRHGRGARRRHACGRTGTATWRSRTATRPGRPSPTASSPDDAAEYDYWDHADYLVERARAHGLTLALLPLFVGHGGDGFKYLTPENAEAYGLFLGRRYGGRAARPLGARRRQHARHGGQAGRLGAAGAGPHDRRGRVGGLRPDPDDLPHQRAELVVAVVPRGPLAGLQHDPGLGRREGHLPEGRGGPGASPAEADGAGRGLVRGRPPVPHPADRRAEGPAAGVLVVPGRGLPHLRQHQHLELRLVQAGGDAGLEGGPPLARGREPVGAREAVHLAGVVGARPRTGRSSPPGPATARRETSRCARPTAAASWPTCPARPPSPWTCARSPGPSPPSRPGSTPGPGRRTASEQVPTAGVRPFSAPEGWQDAILLIEARR